MPAKSFTALEKKIQKTTTSLEDLFKTLGDFVSANFERMADTVVEAGKKKKVARKTSAKKAKTVKSNAASGSKRGRRAGGGLKEAIVEICSGGGVLTEADIAKKLLESPDKYKWNKNESTLYQTLRRAVKENLISDSGRDKDTKTYQVA
jgi:hypothetical protein